MYFYKPFLLTNTQDRIFVFTSLGSGNHEGDLKKLERKKALVPKPMPGPGFVPLQLYI